MRVGHRILAALVAMACLPLALAGWQAMRLARDALDRRTGDLHDAVTGLLAEQVELALTARERSLRQAAGLLLFGDMAPDEVLGALRWTYKQVDEATVVVLLDAAGAQVAEPVYLAEVSTDPSLAGRATVSLEDLRRFGEHIPIQPARSVGAAIGAPYTSASGTPRVCFAAAARGGHVLAVEVALDVLKESISAPRLGKSGRVFLLDERGHVILAQDPLAPTGRRDLSAWTPVAALLEGNEPPRTFEEPIRGEVFGAAARAKSHGWVVVVTEPVKDALAASSELLRQTSFWVLGVLLAGILLGVWVGRSLSRPIDALHSGAVAITQGNLAHRMPGSSRRDDIGDLARAFNQMAEEIQRWNHELESRVEEKTKQLEEIQEVLLRAQKMAAVGQLGAGVAHEINNPLAGVLGLTQILLLKEAAGSFRHENLKKIEAHALRITDIVDNLRRIAEGGKGVALSACDINTVLAASLNTMQAQFERAKIDVDRQLATGLPAVEGDTQRLREVFLELFTNAQRAMAKGGTLRVITKSKDPRLVTIQIEDTGEGIAEADLGRIFEPFFTRKKEWQARGLGLSVVNKLVEMHHGTIKVRSQLGEGTAFDITLPAHQKRSLA